MKFIDIPKLPKRPFSRGYAGFPQARITRVFFLVEEIDAYLDIAKSHA